MAEVLPWHAFPCKNISYQRGVRTCGRGTRLTRDPLPAAMVWVNGAETDLGNAVTVERGSLAVDRPLRVGGSDALARPWTVGESGRPIETFGRGKAKKKKL